MERDEQNRVCDRNGEVDDEAGTDGGTHDSRSIADNTA